MKKAQTEMIGLVIIVILITLGLLFLAIFSIKGDVSKKIFTREGLSYSSVSAIMKTTLAPNSCANNFRPTIGNQLLEDCARNLATSPSGTSQYRCSLEDATGISTEVHSCVYMRALIVELLQQTLDQWAKRYHWESTLIRTGSDTAEPLFDRIDSPRGACPDTAERDSSGIFPIQVRDVGLVNTKLFLCD
jgi:hypothetical protein